MGARPSAVVLCAAEQNVRSTGRIIGFRLLDHFIYDHFHKTYMLVGCVGDDSEENIRKLETIHG